VISPISPLVLVGAGNMGGAMLNGWLDAGTDPAAILVIDPKVSEPMAARLKNAGVRFESAAPEGVTAGILMLAVKPQVMEMVVGGLGGLVGRRPLLCRSPQARLIAFL
jgi:pyrroline-5-carboxylate reductase